MALNILARGKNIDREPLFLAEKKTSLFLKKELNVSLKFVTEEEIGLLNKKFLGKDGPTNVLAFKTGNDEGDIVISPKVISRESKNLGYSKKELLLLYFVHGMLHLSGFDHQKNSDRAKMEEAEGKILANMGINIIRQGHK